MNNIIDGSKTFTAFASEIASNRGKDLNISTSGEVKIMSIVRDDDKMTYEIKLLVPGVEDGKFFISKGSSYLIMSLIEKEGATEPFVLNISSQNGDLYNALLSKKDGIFTIVFDIFTPLTFIV